MTTPPDDEGRIAELRSQRDLAVKQLDAATKGWKKCRQMRGADAHKRAWYFEEQMAKHQATLDRIDGELAKLPDSGG